VPPLPPHRSPFDEFWQLHIKPPLTNNATPVHGSIFAKRDTPLFHNMCIVFVVKPGNEEIALTFFFQLLLAPLAIRQSSNCSRDPLEHVLPRHE
jgi:hypothetical protein